MVSIVRKRLLRLPHPPWDSELLLPLIPGVRGFGPHDFISLHARFGVCTPLLLLTVASSRCTTQAQEQPALQLALAHKGASAYSTPNVLQSCSTRSREVIDGREEN